MNLESEIKKFLSYEKKEIVFYELLLIFEKDQDNINCFKCVKELYHKVDFAINQFHNLSPSLKNKLENDFITLKDIDEEFKNNVYPHFNNQVLSIYIGFKTEELQAILRLLNDKSFDLSVQALLLDINRMFSMISEKKTEYNMTINKYKREVYSKEKISDYVMVIRKSINELKTSEYNDLYYKILARYFANMYKGSKM